LLNTPFVFVGTYTEPEGSQSEGVYVYRMKPSSGELMFVRAVKDIINPSYLAIHPQQGFFYAVNEVQTYREQSGGGVSAFSVNSGETRFLNERRSNGNDPESGNLIRTGYEIGVSMPVFLKFSLLKYH
jgi:6-phosphogluconolactonase